MNHEFIRKQGKETILKTKTKGNRIEGPLVSGKRSNVIELDLADLDFYNAVIESGTRIFPKEEVKRFSLCMQCGKCVGSCPSGKRTAWRIRKIFRETQLGLREKVTFDENLWNCTTCYTCQERCPRGIHTTDIVRIIRNLAVRSGHMKSNHKRVCQILFRYGHTVPLNDDIRMVRKELGLDEIPPTVHSYPEGLKEILTLFEKTGFRKMVEQEGK